MDLDPDAVQLEVGHGRAADPVPASADVGRRRGQHGLDRDPDLQSHRVQRVFAAGRSAAEPPRSSRTATSPPGGRSPTGTPYACASPSWTSESRAPWRSSPNTRPRSRPCSGSVARPNRSAACLARAEADPGSRQVRPSPRRPHRPRSRSASASTAGGGNCCSDRQPSRYGVAAGSRRGRTRRSRCRRRSPRTPRRRSDRASRSSSGSRPAPPTRRPIWTAARRPMRLPRRYSRGAGTVPGTMQRRGLLQSERSHELSFRHNPPAAVRCGH